MTKSDFPRERITYPAGPTKGEPIEIGHEAEYSSLSNGPQRQRVTGTSYSQEWQSRVWIPRVHFSGFTVPLKQILGQVLEPIRFNLPIEVPYDRAKEIVEGIDKGHAFTVGWLFVDSDKETFLATLAEVWDEQAQNVRMGASYTPDGIATTNEEAKANIDRAREQGFKLRDLANLGALTVLKDSPTENVSSGAGALMATVEFSGLYGIYDTLKEIEQEINRGHNVASMVEDAIGDIKQLIENRRR